MTAAAAWHIAATIGHLVHILAGWTGYIVLGSGVVFTAMVTWDDVARRRKARRHAQAVHVKELRDEAYAKRMRRQAEDRTWDKTMQAACGRCSLGGDLAFLERCTCPAACGHPDCVGDYTSFTRADVAKVVARMEEEFK